MVAFGHFFPKDGAFIRLIAVSVYRIYLNTHVFLNLYTFLLCNKIALYNLVHPSAYVKQKPER